MYKRFSAAVAAFVFISNTAVAATITASPLFPEISGFVIEYEDTNNNGLLDYLEQTSFSGYTTLNGTYTFLVGTPDLAGISAYGNGGFAWPNDAWSFSGSIGLVLPQVSLFSYEVTGNGDPNVVPVPASLPLALAGLGILGFMRRKRPLITRS